MFDFLKDVASSVGDIFTPAVQSAAATVGGFLGQQNTNAQNMQIARENTQFQERMSNTAYQRQVKDMEAAGLNPMLAYLKGGGASTPTGSITQVQNPYLAASTSGYQSAQSSLAHKQVPKVGAETENIGADTVYKRANALYAQALTQVAGATADEKRANINLIEYHAKEISEKIKNIPKEGNRLEAAAQQLVASATFINNQSRTEVQREAQMRALVTKTLQESNLLNADLEALEKSGNLGKEFGQYTGVIQTIISVLRVLNR